MEHILASIRVRTILHLMNYPNIFRIRPGSCVHLRDFDPDYSDKHEDKHWSVGIVEDLQQRMNVLQFALYAEQKRSLLIVLQALDASGTDGVVRHVVGFKQPSAEELAHDFLWRIEQQIPKRGEVVIFNRSQYEDVLVVRVHELVPTRIWSQRYEQINDFERRLVANGTHLLKFFLHLSQQEQLRRFK